MRWEKKKEEGSGPISFPEKKKKGVRFFFGY